MISSTPLYPTILFNLRFNSTKCFPCLIFRRKRKNLFHLLPYQYDNGQRTISYILQFVLLFQNRGHSLTTYFTPIAKIKIFGRLDKNSLRKWKEKCVLLNNFICIKIYYMNIIHICHYIHIIFIMHKICIINIIYFIYANNFTYNIYL